MSVADFLSGKRHVLAKQTEAVDLKPPLVTSVFISYSRRDSTFVRRLHDALVLTGREVWIDWEDIPPTADWSSEIQQAIEAADAVVFVITPDSVVSRECRRELAHAISHNKRLVPVVARAVATSHLPEGVARLNWISCRADDDFDLALGMLNKALDTDLDWLREHTRLLVRAREWRAKQGDSSLLLRGSDLRDAEQWLVQARGHAEAATPDHTEYVIASRRQSTKRQRLVTAVVAGFLIAAVILAAWAEQQRRVATEQRQLAVGRQLIAQAELARNERADLLQRSVLLGLEAAARAPGQEAEQTLRRALALLPISVLRLRHPGGTADVAFSPDGRYLASAGAEERTVRLWELATGTQVAELPHEGKPFRLEFSSDGRRLVTVEAHQMSAVARLWELRTGRHLADAPQVPLFGHTLFSPDGAQWATVQQNLVRLRDAETGAVVSELRHRGPVGPTVFSPSGLNLAASSSADNSVHIWNLRTQSEEATLPHDQLPVVMVYSPDGQYLATATVPVENGTPSLSKADGTTRIWDIKSGRVLTRLPHGGAVTFVAFSPDGRYVATGGMERIARVWAVSDGREVARVPHDGNIVALVFDPSGRYLATGSADRAARVWESMTGREVARLPHDDLVMSIRFSPDGSLVASASLDGTVQVWRPSGGLELFRLRHEGSVRRIAFSPDGRYVVTASEDKTARLWDTVGGHEVASLPHEEGSGVLQSIFSSNGRHVATASGKTARVWDVPSGREVLRLGDQAGPDDVFLFVAFSPDGRYLATAGRQHTGKVWETATGRLLLEVAHGQPIIDWVGVPDGLSFAAGAVIFSPSGQRLLTAGHNALRIWDLGSGAEVLAVDNKGDDVFTAAFSPDGRYLASGNLDKTTRIWEADTGLELAVLPHLEAVLALAFAPDGGYLATGSYDRRARIWKLPEGREVVRLPHEHMVHSVAFDASGRYLASGSRDRTARVWDAGSGQEVMRVFHEDSVLRLAFSPDGQTLATASADGTARLSSVQQEGAGSPCSRLTRNLSLPEWRQFIGDEAYRPTCPELPIPGGSEQARR